ncbi:hypothetical protein ACFTSF_10740 [Kribbella sp. NPDC056951]|uniref:hypothetical protein n=1 Tax=Kribbella sp. NPDC056951 TaxID=3345978 RepID=UPI0036315A50
MKVTFAGVVRSEWTKLVSLPSNVLLLTGVPVLFAALSAVIGANSHGPADPTLAVGGGFLLYALAVGILGMVMVTGEYQSGLMRSTLTAVPRRVPVLLAKAGVLLGAVGPVMVAAYFGAFLANQAFTDSAARISLGDPGIVAALLGAAGATIGAGLLGLALGTLLRSTPGSIATYVVTLLVLPPSLLAAVPAAAQDRVLPFVPTIALQGMFQVGERSPGMFSPGGSALVVLAWVILMLAGAAVVLQRRDI